VTTKTVYLGNTSRVDISVLVIWHIFTVCMLGPLVLHGCPLLVHSEGFLLVLVGFGECREVGMYDILIWQLGFLIVQYCSPVLNLYAERASSTWFLLPQEQINCCLPIVESTNGW
jgi:hypothetical protein